MTRNEKIAAGGRTLQAATINASNILDFTPKPEFSKAYSTEDALDFLRTHTADWPVGWVLQLAAIRPAEREGDESNIEAFNVSPDNLEPARKWLEGRQGKANVYFGVNPVQGQFGKAKKASKKDIAALAYLHIDLDPEKGKPLKAERERLLGEIERFPFKPSLVVNSGNGYGVFWRLEKPVAVNGNADELEQMNKRLAVHFGADHCHNIDRVMRLPGTVNLPDWRKRKAGRVPVPATLIEQNDRAYSFDDFNFLPEAPQVRKAEVVGDLGNEQIPAKFWEDLKVNLKLAKRWKGNPDGLKDKSRSGFDMSLASLLARLNYSDAEIAAILRGYPHGKAKERGDDYNPGHNRESSRQKRF